MKKVYSSMHLYQYRHTLLYIRISNIEKEIYPCTRTNVYRDVYRCPTSFPLPNFPWSNTYGHFPLPCPSSRTTSSWATLSWPFCDAMYNGVAPSFCFACTSALLACDAPSPHIPSQHTTQEQDEIRTSDHPYVCIHA